MNDCCSPCLTPDQLQCLMYSGEVVKSLLPTAPGELTVTYVNLTTGATRTAVNDVDAGTQTGGGAPGVAQTFTGQSTITNNGPAGI